MSEKPKVGIFKFTGCAGCQMEIFRMEDQFLNLLKLFDITYWKMAKRNNEEKGWDIALVEGGISTPWEIKEIKCIRKKTKFLVAFGDCAISGWDLLLLQDVALFAQPSDANVKVVLDQ